MHDAGSGICLVAGAACAFAGMAWLALAMPAHALQAWGRLPAPRQRALLRVLGAVAIAAALACCLAGDHATMAVLVWTMFLAAAGMATALLLATRPGVLRVLAPWVRLSRAGS